MARQKLVHFAGADGSWCGESDDGERTLARVTCVDCLDRLEMDLEERLEVLDRESDDAVDTHFLESPAKLIPPTRWRRGGD
jgi:hypothetical protein